MYQSYEELEAACKSCTRCPLSETRTNVVVGVGSTDTPLMFIGEGPGEQEDLTGVPFVGRAGQLLDKFLDAVELDRTMIYIANMVKCRPPKNRDPLPEEQEACLPFLRSQLQLIKPKLIVCLGRVSAVRLIKPDFRITKERGQWFQKGEYSFMATYHPSYLLRDPRKRPEAMEDFLDIRRRYDECMASR